MTEYLKRADVEREINRRKERLRILRVECEDGSHPATACDSAAIELELLRATLAALPSIPQEGEGLLDAVGAVIEFSFEDEFGCKATPMEEFEAMETAYRASLKPERQ